MRIVPTIISTALLLASSIATAKTLSSSMVEIKPSRITNRVVLAENLSKALRVQVLEVFEEGSTDYSNTSKLVLAISALGEMRTLESNFVIGKSRRLESAKRIAPGIYQLKHLDADKGMESQLVTIDATKALSDIRNSKCEDFSTCEISTSIKVK